MFNMDLKLQTSRIKHWCFYSFHSDFITYTGNTNVPMAQVKTLELPLFPHTWYLIHQHIFCQLSVFLNPSAFHFLSPSPKFKWPLLHFCNSLTGSQLPICLPTLHLQSTHTAPSDLTQVSFRSSYLAKGFVMWNKNKTLPLTYKALHKLSAPSCRLLHLLTLSTKTDTMVHCCVHLNMPGLLNHNHDTSHLRYTLLDRNPHVSRFLSRSLKYGLFSISLVLGKLALKPHIWQVSKYSIY